MFCYSSACGIPTLHFFAAGLLDSVCNKPYDGNILFLV